MPLPKPTPLSHENHGYGLENPNFIVAIYDPAVFGGWDVAAKKLTPFRDYAAFSVAIRERPNQYVPCLVVLDAVTAAVEHEVYDYLRQENLFANQDDWLAFGRDLEELGANTWLNERHQHALNLVGVTDNASYWHVSQEIIDEVWPERDE